MSETISLAQYKATLPKKKGADKEPQKQSKLRNRPTTYNGITYQSKKEARRAAELDWMVHLGEIKAWKAQVPFKLEISGILICTYILDFLIEHNDGTFTHEDCKGRKAGGPYQLFKVKQHLMKAIHNIDVKEV